MIIYKATNNIDGKFYIGLTKRPLEKRIKQHINHIKRSKAIFLNALNKHGPENFKWEVIDSDATSYDHLKELEIWYIANLKPEYNMTTGGDGSSNRPCPWKNKKLKPLSNDHKQAISISSKGRKLSIECKNKLSEAHKGKIISLEQRQKISKALMGNIPWNKGIKQKDYIKGSSNGIK